MEEYSTLASGGWKNKLPFLKRKSLLIWPEEPPHTFGFRFEALSGFGFEPCRICLPLGPIANVFHPDSFMFSVSALVPFCVFSWKTNTKIKLGTQTALFSRCLVPFAYFPDRKHEILFYAALCCNNMHPHFWFIIFTTLFFTLLTFDDLDFNIRLVS